jgi:A/G-specific adenine glycosylase
MSTPKPPPGSAEFRTKPIASHPGSDGRGEPLPPIATRLLAWYDRCGRDLPWRHSADPYRIWLSEIMLQQTGVKAVQPYYERFVARFPTLFSLAAAPVEEVIGLWAGLGYYSRARNLHRTAQIVAKTHGGLIPDDPEELLALPGIGRSTAGAILAIAFNRKAPILDGNVRRVLCRLLALRVDPRRPDAERRLWACAEELTPAEHPGDYAQAIMDLGANLCVPKRPACPACPLEDLCRGRQAGWENEIPVRRRKKPTPTVVEIGLLLTRNGRILARRRPLEGLLGGLWEFPTARVEAGENPDATAKALLERLGFRGELAPALEVRHAYSHFRLSLHLFSGQVTEAAHPSANETGRWFSAGELSALPLHGAHKKALSFVLERG